MKTEKSIIEVQAEALLQMEKAGEVEMRTIHLKDEETGMVYERHILHSV